MNPYLARMKEIKAKMDGLLNVAKADGERVFTEEETNLFDGFKNEYSSVKNMADAYIVAQNAGDNIVEPAGTTPRIEITDKKPLREFENVADLLTSVKVQAVSGSCDERLIKLNNALGLNAGSGSDGGFAIQSDFAGNMFDSAAKSDGILSRVDKYQITSNSDRVYWNDIKETSIASTVFGGVVVYRTPEAQTATATMPQLEQKELKLEKLMGFCYVSDEMEKSSSFTDQLITRAFGTAIDRTVSGEVVSGSGVARCIGILNGGGAVSVAKESNQVAETILYKNISKMYHRAFSDTRSNYVWLMHPDAHEQLDFLSMPVGTGGVPVYLPASSVGTLPALKGCPIVESDHCSALGTVGDINFTDLSDYLFIYKGNVDKQVSIHVQFLTAQNCYRFIMYSNGMPKKNSALTIKNSSKTRSSIITLATRA